jgi:hypothetical protein
MTKLPAAIASAKLAGEHFADLQRQQDSEGWTSLLAHVRELRNRLVKMGLALAAGMSVGFVFFGPV